MSRPMSSRRIHSKVCVTCQQPFMAVYRKNQFCSRACVTTSNRSAGIDNITFALLVEANDLPHVDQKLDHIIKQVGVTDTVVYNRMQELSYTWNRVCISRAATPQTKARMKDSGCTLCAETRVIELAHIVPACEGGSATDNNLVALCPNHHRLYDSGKLNQQESEDLEYHFQKKFNLHWEAA